MSVSAHEMNQNLEQCPQFVISFPPPPSPRYLPREESTLVERPGEQLPRGEREGKRDVGSETTVGSFALGF